MATLIVYSEFPGAVDRSHRALIMAGVFHAGAGHHLHDLRQETIVLLLKVCLARTLSLALVSCNVLKLIVVTI